LTDSVIDLSHWQAPVNFGTLRTSGIQAVILKATQGSSWIDPTFMARSTAAQIAGLLVGAYHFADASNPIAQAAHFLTIAGGLPRLAVDIEPNGMGDTVSIAQAAELVARLQAVTDRLPLVYIGRYGPTGTGAGLPNSVLSRCPLWLYETESAVARLPAGWATWCLWQYDQNARVAGVGSICDRSRFNGTADQLAAWWGS